MPEGSHPELGDSILSVPIQVRNHNPLPQGRRVSAKEEKKPTQGRVFADKLLKDVIYFVLIVMFIGVATMFVATVTQYIDSFKSKEASFEDLKDKIQEQNVKIDAITAGLKKNKIIPQ